jgi:hypothetical protein
MEDKRQQKRFAKRCKVKFSANNRTYRGISGNFSLNGLFVKTDRPFVRDTSLDIVVCLPDGSTSQLRGKVVRASKISHANAVRIPLRKSENGIGVTIVERDVHYLHLIRSLLVKRTVRFDKIGMEAEFDKWVQERLAGKTPESASAEFEAFASDMQRKLGVRSEETDLQKLFAMPYDELTDKQQQITDALMEP